MIKPTHKIRAYTLKSGLCFYELHTWDLNKANEKYQELYQKISQGTRIEWVVESETGKYIRQAFAYSKR